MKIYEEDFSLEYESEKDLSYYDSGTDYIDLYHKHDFVGYLQVWQDSEMNGREYIIINHTIIYLNTIEKINSD